MGGVSRRGTGEDGTFAPDESKLNRLAGGALAGLIRLVKANSRVVYDPPDLLARLAANHPAHHRHLARAVHDDAGLPPLARH